MDEFTVKIFAFLVICTCSCLGGYYWGKHQAGIEISDAGVLGRVADAKAMSHTILLMQSGQVEKARQYQTGYLGVVRIGLINVRNGGLSSPILDEAITEIDGAIKPKASEALSSEP